MEYFLSLTDNAMMIFGSNDKTRKKAGFIEYFDTANPIGLLKAHFCIMVNAGSKSEVELITEFNKTITDDAAKRVVNTFEKIEQQIVAKGILPSTVVVTGIYFFNNQEAGYVQQVIRYYVYPKKPRNYSLTVGGRHVMLYHESNIIQDKPAEANGEVVTNQHPNHGKGKKHKHKKHAENQSSKPVNDAGNVKTDTDGIDEKEVDTSGEEVPDNLPIVDNVVSTEVETTDVVNHDNEGIHFSTDTGISEPVNEELYHEVIDREEVDEIVTLLELPADSGSIDDQLIKQFLAAGEPGFVDDVGNDSQEAVS